MENRYKHIFDYFNKRGEFIGGIEPVTDTTDKPLSVHHDITNCYIVYLGWCYEDDALFCGHCFKDNVERDSETKQLKPIMETVTYNVNAAPVERVKFCGIRGDVTYEEDCEFLGVEPCESYLKFKAEKEKRFEEEWNKVINNKEYFRKQYYRGDKL